MNRLLITRKEFKSDEEKSFWKSYEKYPGMPMVRKPEDQHYNVYMVATDQVHFHSCCLLFSSKVLNRDVIPSYYKDQQQSISVGDLEDKLSQQEGMNQAPE